MDLNRMPNDKKLHLCKCYFKGGWALLPFLWAVNAIWFFKEAFVKPAFEEQKEIRKYVIMSAVGATVWTAVIVAWVSIYQLHRTSWGNLGDDLSFIIPLGKA